MGAEVVDVSIPEHKQGPAVLWSIVSEGASTLLHANGMDITGRGCTILALWRPWASSVELKPTTSLPR